MSEDNIVAGIVGGVIGGSAGFKAGYDAGYEKKEQECQIVVGSLQLQLTNANQTIETLRKGLEELKSENERLRSEKSIFGRVKGALNV